MVKGKKNTKQTLEVAIDGTNPVRLIREFLLGVYTIIDDLLTIYVSVYSVLDKLTDNSVCNITVPKILENICRLEGQIESLLLIFGELPAIIANSPDLAFISGQMKIINVTVKGLFGTLDLLKDKLFRDIGIPSNIDICNQGTLLTNKICVHLQQASDNKILIFIKKIGNVLVIFKKWFNTLEPIFRLEKMSITDLFSAGQDLSNTLSPEIAQISEDLDKETSKLKDDIKQNVSNIEGLQQNVSNITGLNQVGGGYNAYNFIIDPHTKEKYYLNSPKGISLLNIYMTDGNL